MSRSNCVIFAALLLWWRWRRWKQNPALPEPYLVLRPSRAGGPFHLLVGTKRENGMLSLISYKPRRLSPLEKEEKKESWYFDGQVRRGD